MTPKLVIFDCDGVLVDTEPTTDRVMSANFARYGLVLPPEEVGALFIGGTMKGAGEVAVSMGARLPHDWMDIITAEVNEALSAGVDVYDGVIALVDDLTNAGVATAIASNGPPGKMRVSLGPSGLWDRFDGRIHSGREGGPKPLPDMLFAACADAGVDPTEAVMIDDTQAGWKAAKAAGMPCFAFMPDKDKPADLFGATYVTSMADIRAAVLP